VGFEVKRLNMNRADYKVKRNKPKPNTGITKSKKRMLANPNATTNTSLKLSTVYSSKTEWATKLLPKLKEQ